jgi:hypothetical protein
MRHDPQPNQMFAAGHATVADAGSAGWSTRVTKRALIRAGGLSEAGGKSPE